ncbi:MAG: hypothetical protein MHM6MM_008054 [Cercozoa sp. M6MM]
MSFLLRRLRSSTSLSPRKTRDNKGDDSFDESGPRHADAEAANAEATSTLRDLRSHFNERKQRDELHLRDFEIINTLGTGTFGRVCAVKYRHNLPVDGHSRVFALKKMQKAKILQLKQLDHIRDEKAVLEEIDHPLVVQYIVSWTDEFHVFMLMEFIVGGELFTFLRQSGRFSKDIARFYAAELVLVLEYLHARQLIYRDLKPENLLINRNGHLKVVDFGFCKKVPEKTYTLCGTPEYLAPEIIDGKIGHSFQVDWWALGILLYEMLCGFPPFYDENPFKIYEKIVKGTFKYPKHVDSSSRDLINKLLRADVTRRLGCGRGGVDEIKKHKFFKGIDWQSHHTWLPPNIPQITGPDDTRCFERYPDEDPTVSPPYVRPMDQQLFDEF